MGTRTCTYYTGTITGQAGALVTLFDTVLVTGEGWTRTYYNAGTHEAVYQQAGGNGFSFYVNDNGTGAGAAREAIVRGCESATAYNVLVDPFPTVGQVADASCVWRKSSTADATARTYWAVADDRNLVLIIRDSATTADVFWFCDVEKFAPSDNYATIINNRGAANSATAAIAVTVGLNLGLSTNLGGNQRAYVARTSDGTIKSSTAAHMCVGTGSNSFGLAAASGVATYPGPSAKLVLAPVWVNSTGATTAVPGASAELRGCLPFLFTPMHGNTKGSIADLDTFTASAYDASSAFLIIGLTAGNINAATVILQTAGTWDCGM